MVTKHARRRHTPVGRNALATFSSDAVVAVVGAGAMGAGIAQVAAVAGHRVLLLDNRPQAAQLAIDGLRTQLDKLAAKGKMTAQAALAASHGQLPGHA